MTFEETIDWLREQEGKGCEVAIYFDLDERELLTGFGGILAAPLRTPLRAVKAGDHDYAVRLNGSGTSGLLYEPGLFHLLRRVFASASVEAEVPPPDARADTGTVWVLTVRYRNALTAEFIIYA